MMNTPDMSNARFDGDRPAEEEECELVPWDSRCPKCDEQRMDFLVWVGDWETGETVVCYTCGHRYEP